MKKIAVVILNWNGKSLLEKFLPSVTQFSDLATIYVIDNASTDESNSFLLENYPAVKIIRNDGNYGFAKGYNLGLKDIQEEYLALINSDIEVTENWLQPIIDLFETSEETCIIQPKILDYKKKTHFEYAGAAGGFIDKYGYPFCRGRIFETIEEDNGQYDDESQIFWASGACFFIRNKTFKMLNGFDEDFFAHQEEIDLCWRAFNLDCRIFYTYKSVVYHIGGATLGATNPHKTFLNFRNSLAMLVKNLPANKILPVILSRMLLDGLAFFKFIFDGNFLHGFSILKAHFYFYIHIGSNFKKRSNSLKTSYYKVKSVVYQHFLKKIYSYKNLL